MSMNKDKAKKRKMAWGKVEDKDELALIRVSKDSIPMARKKPSSRSMEGLLRIVTVLRLLKALRTLKELETV